MKNVIFTTPKHAGLECSTNAPVIAITYREPGYHPIFTATSIDALNELGVTTEVQDAAVAGSMFGWNCPGAAAAVEFFNRA